MKPRHTRIWPGRIVGSAAVCLGLSWAAGAQQLGASLQLYVEMVSLGKVSPFLVAASLRVSPDSRRAAYAVEDKQKRIYVDGKPGPKHHAVSYPYFSPDSQKVAYVAAGKKNARLLINGKAGKSYEQIGPPVFSDDSKRIAYAALRKGRWFLSLDRKEGPPFDEVGEIRFSPDGLSVAYLARRGAANLIVITGARNEELPDAAAGKEFGFSPDSRHFYYVAGGEEGQRLVLDGVSGPPFSRVNAPIFSADSKRMAYQVQQEGKLSIVLDGETIGQLYDGVSHPVFSPDSKRFAYIAKLGPSSQVIVDNRVGPAFDSLGTQPLRFSPDSQHFAYVGRRGDDYTVQVDHLPGPAFRGVQSGTLSFSPDGAHLAYGAKDEDGYSLALDHQLKKVKPLERLGPRTMVFSPDSQHVAFWARRRNAWRLCVDGVEAPKDFTGFLSGSRVVWDSNTSLYGLAMRGNTIYRVHVTIGD